MRVSQSAPLHPFSLGAGFGSSPIPWWLRVTQILKTSLLGFLPVKDDQEAVLCFYKTAKDCVMMFTYSELPSGKSNLTVLREPGG